MPGHFPDRHPAHTALAPRIYAIALSTGTLPRAAWREQATPRLLPIQARDDVQWTEIAGDLQRRVTMVTTAAQAFAGLCEKGGGWGLPLTRSRQS